MSEQDLSKLRIDRTARRKGARRPVLRWLITIVVISGIVAAFFAWRSTRPIVVETATVVSAYPSANVTVFNATGYAVAQRKAAVSSKATGRLEWLGVREGSLARKGEVLARLESRDVVATMEQAAANVKLAEANHEQASVELRDAQRAFGRSEELLRKNFVSQASHDSALARLDKARSVVAGQQAAIGVAEANLRAARVAVDQTLIRAPFDGVVLTKNANVGDVITPFSSATGSQAAVVTMADMSTLEVEADVSESSIGKVKTGQPCEIQLDALPGRRFRGVVGSMVPTVDRAKATVTVKVRFIAPDAGILPEMSAKVAFLSEELPESQRTPRTAVQPAALVEREGTVTAFVVLEGRVRQTVIEAGGKLGELIEIRKGLNPGDKVVTKPDARLRDGAAVAVPGK